MLAMADTVALCTDAEGTQLVLTVRSRDAEAAGPSAAGPGTAGRDKWLEWAA